MTAEEPRDGLDLALAEMAELLPMATKKTGRRPLTDDLVEARDQLAELALTATRRFDISRRELSLALGLHKDAIGHILRTRGEYEDPTQGINQKGAKRTVCKRGHDLTLPNARTPRGNCRECWRLQKRRATEKRTGITPAQREAGVSLQLARLVAPRTVAEMTSEEVYAAVLEAIAAGAHTPAKLAAAALEAAQR